MGTISSLLSTPAITLAFFRVKTHHGHRRVLSMCKNGGGGRDNVYVHKKCT